MVAPRSASDDEAEPEGPGIYRRVRGWLEGAGPQVSEPPRTWNLPLDHPARVASCVKQLAAMQRREREALAFGFQCRPKQNLPKETTWTS